MQDYEKLKNSNLKKRKHTDISSTGSELAVINKKLKQSTLTDVASGSKSVNLDKLIVQFIVETMSPVSIVEYKSFKALIGGAQQLAKPPNVMCRRTAKIKISNEYNEFKKNIKAKMNTVEFVCSTADVWSSSRRSYLGITVHWIESDTFERKNAAIACRRFKGSHTYDKVAEMIADIHADHDLKLSKIVKTVTDNGSNMVKAFDVFGKTDLEPIENNEHVSHIDEDIEETTLAEGDEDDDSLLLLQAFPDASSSLDLESDYLLPVHERCATHTLHLIASTDFKQARLKNNIYKKLHDAALAKCQALWNLCSRSPKACETYLEMTGKSPTSPCATRWNSYFNSIQDLLAVQTSLSETMKMLKLPPLKENETHFLTEYVVCSKPIAEAIQSLQGEKHTYYGSLLPELVRIQHVIKCLRTENLKYCGPLLDVIEENLNRRFKKFLQFEPAANDAILASVTLPFFKMKWVPKARKEYVKELILTETRKINRSEKQKLDSLEIIEGEKKRSKDESYYMFLEDSDSSVTSTENTGSTADLETLQYLNNKDTDIKILNVYPTIKKIFLKYNTCLPSSAPVERLFSFGGMIMRPHRRKMSDKLFEELVLLKALKAS